MTDKPNIPPQKPGEGSKDYRKRIYPPYKGNRNRRKLRKTDAEIQAEGDAKFEPTPEDLKPKTPEEIEAAKKGLEEAKKRMADKTFKPERDEDGFIKSIATDQIKNILKYGLPVKSTYSGVKSIGIPTLKYLFLNDGRF